MARSMIPGSPTTKALFSSPKPGSANVLATISGPTPAGSPIVTAMSGVCMPLPSPPVQERLHGSYQCTRFSEGPRLGEDPVRIRPDEGPHRDARLPLALEPDPHSAP